MIITKYFHWDGCGVCPPSKARIQALSAAGYFSDYREFELNSDPSAFSEYNVTQVPTVLIFENGVETQRYTGVRPVASFLTQVEATNCVDGICTVPSTGTGTGTVKDPNMTPATTPDTSMIDTGGGSTNTFNNGAFKLINLLPIAAVGWWLLRKR